MAAVVDQVGDAVDDQRPHLADDSIAQQFSQTVVGDEPAAVKAQGKRNASGAAGVQ